VKFANRNDSNLAITSLHLKFAFPGAKSPIRVSYAQAKNNQQKYQPSFYPAPGFGVAHGMFFGGQHHSQHFGMYPTFISEVKLFVASLPPHVNETFLQTLFSSYGTVTEVYILRNPDGIPKGSAFVKFANLQQAQQAIAVLNGFLLPGFSRPLIVRFANSVNYPSSSTTTTLFPQYFQNRYNLNANDNTTKLFVGGLPLNVTEQHIMGIFYPFGTITDIFIMRKPDGTGKGAAFVKFSTREEAEAAIKNIHNIVTVPGSFRPLTVKFAYVSEENNQES